MDKYVFITEETNFSGSQKKLYDYLSQSINVSSSFTSSFATTSSFSLTASFLQNQAEIESNFYYYSVAL